MKNYRPLATSLLGMSIVWTASVPAAGEPEAGKIKAEPCLGCHGVASSATVYPHYKVPKIGGQHVEYLVSALKAYQAGQRNHPTMDGQALSLTEQEIQEISAYFASLGK